MATRNYTKYRKNFPKDNQFHGLLGAPETEFCLFFAQGMANRMAISYHKYGAVSEAYPDRVDAIESLKARLELYIAGGVIKGQKIAPGNSEYLIDVANFAMIEFMHPKHPKAFFKATDSDGSPGRVWNDGDVSARGHGEAQRNAEIENFYAKRGAE